MSKEVINVRLPDGINIQDIDKQAELFGISRSAYITKAIKLYLDLDIVNLAKLQKKSSENSMSVGILVNQMMDKNL